MSVTVRGKVSAKSSGNCLDMLFGINIEHMGRTVYGGIYEGESEYCDAQGFRKDVLDALKDMKLSCIRYPGGNFVSGYHWRDGIGPIEERPVKLNIAWKQVEPNKVGLHEIADYAERLGTQLLMNFNLGSADIQESLDLFEYTNFPGETTLTRQRKKNGREKPFSIRYWGLGNEMDGRWQICNMEAEQYAKKAKELARLVKLIDPEAKLILVGSSKPLLKTFGMWDKTVLDIAYEQVDFLSMHSYFDCPDYFVYKNKSIKEYIGVYAEIQKNIDLIAAIIRETKLRKKSKHDVFISFDEWNVWHRDPRFINENRFSGSKEWLASDARIECVYDFKDVILYANMINTLIRNSDVVKLACVCQAVNCIAPILAYPNGKMVKQTVYYPYWFAGNYLKGEYVPVDYSSDTIHSESFGDYEQVNIISTENGNIRAVLAVNNSETEEVSVELSFPEILERNFAQIMKNAPEAVNSTENPEEVIPKDFSVNVLKNKVCFTLPAFSVAMLAFKKK